MKTKLILRTMGLLFVMVSLFALSSCTKNADQSLTKEQKAQQDSGIVVSTVDEKDITESEEDLTTVDYKEFYDQLSPYGEWVEVSFEDIGLKPPTASLKNSDNNHSVIANILGIKTAYADANVAMTFVWKPSPEFAMVTTVGQTPQYVPYTNGQWVYSDVGWYFKAPTPWEETVHHQGRWVNSPSAGWMWVPGRVWAPAWVDWRQNDEYISWAPLPPSVYYVDGNFNNYQINDDDYSICERSHFLDPDIYRYSSPYYESGSRISMGLFGGIVGLVVVDNIIINRGPDVKVIQTYYPNNIINVVNIRHVRSFNEVRYSDKEYYVYSPQFKRYKNKGHPEYRKYEPKSYKKFAIWKENNKESRKNDKSFNNENKGNDNRNKGNNNMRQNNGINNEKQNKRNNIEKQNRGNYIEKQNKGINNEKQNKRNNIEKQNKGNYNEKQNKRNNNEKQNKINNIEKQNKGNYNEKQNKRNNIEKHNNGNNIEKQNKRNNNEKQNKGNNNLRQSKGNQNGYQHQQKGNQQNENMEKGKK